MAIPALDVFLNGTLAGALRRKANGNLQFRYDAAHVEQRMGAFAGPVAERIAAGIGERAERFV